VIPQEAEKGGRYLGGGSVLIYSVNHDSRGTIMSTITADRPVTTSQAQVAGAPPRTAVGVALDRLADVLAAHSITVLRVSLGLVFLVFAAFKFVSGASPAEELAVATVGKLTFGVVTGSAALLLTAVTETVIGLTLVTGRFLRLGLLVLAGALVGILSPLVLFPGQMWGEHGPTLTGQYVFKDIVLAAAGLVVAAHTLGARLRRG
jgi:putative oxidoreductase